jgi:hypothetical protein
MLPLILRTFSSPDNQMFQYFITVVPTKLHTYKISADTHQFAVTERVSLRTRKAPPLTPTPLPYPFNVCCISLHLKIVHSIVQHLILAIFVVHREKVNLAIVSAWHLVL